MRAREIRIAKLGEHRICGTTYVRYFIQRKCTADMTSVGLAQARPNKLQLDISRVRKVGKKCGLPESVSLGHELTIRGRYRFDDGKHIVRPGCAGVRYLNN